MGQKSMKRSELESLGDGDRIIVGSKEVELGDPISTPDFLAGRCFDSGGGGGPPSSLPSAPPSLPSIGNKPFKIPVTNQCEKKGVQATGGTAAPSFKSGVTRCGF